MKACHAKGVECGFYDYAPRDKDHSIWIPGSAPHKLFPDLEREIAEFMGRTPNGFAGNAMFIRKRF